MKMSEKMEKCRFKIGYTNNFPIQYFVSINKFLNKINFEFDLLKINELNKKNDCRTNEFCIIESKNDLCDSIKYDLFIFKKTYFNC